MRINYLLLIIAIISTLTIFTVDVSASSEEIEAYGMTVSELKDVTGLQDSLNVAEYMACLGFHRSNTRTRSMTATSLRNEDACNNDFLSEEGYDFDQGGRTVANKKRLWPSYAPNPAQDFPKIAISNWDGSTTPYTRREDVGGIKSVYKGLSYKQPPSCPLFVDKMPSASQGGSDYCLCGDKTISVNEQVLCLENSFNYFCSDKETCGSNTQGGFLTYKTSTTGDSRYISTYFENSDTQIDIVSNSDSDHQNALLGKVFYEDIRVFQEDYPARQSYSTWVFLSEESDEFIFQLEFLKRGFAHFDIKQLDVSNSGAWTLTSVDEFKYNERNGYDLLESNIRNDEVVNLGPTSLNPGWYFVELQYTAARRDHIPIGSLLFLKSSDLSNTYNPLDFFDVINQGGPMSFDLSLFEEDEDMALWACENDPYFPGKWDDEWKVNDSGDPIYTQEAPIERRCCGNNPNLDFGFRNNANGAVCIGGAADPSWQTTPNCVDSQGSDIEGTHYNSNLGLCCGADFDSGGEGICQYKEEDKSIIIHMLGVDDSGSVTYIKYDYINEEILVDESSSSGKFSGGNFPLSLNSDTLFEMTEHGFVFSYFSGNGNNYLASIDFEGNISWDKDYDLSITDLKVGSDGNLYIAQLARVLDSESGETILQGSQTSPHMNLDKYEDFIYSLIPDDIVLYDEEFNRVSDYSQSIDFGDYNPYHFNIKDEDNIFVLARDSNKYNISKFSLNSQSKLFNLEKSMVHYYTLSNLLVDKYNNIFFTSGDTLWTTKTSFDSFDNLHSFENQVVSLDVDNYGNIFAVKSSGEIRVINPQDDSNSELSFDNFHVKGVIIESNGEGEDFCSGLESSLCGQGSFELCEWFPSESQGPSLPKNVGVTGPDDTWSLACFDNLDHEYDFESGDIAPISYADNSAHVWRSASNFLFVVMQINNTFNDENYNVHYVSDGTKWHYCNATDLNVDFGEAVSESRSVNVTSDVNQLDSCSYNLAEFLNLDENFTPIRDEGVIVSDCDDTTYANCVYEALQEDYDGFCMGDDNPATFEDDFFDDCSSKCYVRTESSFVTMINYLNALIDDDQPFNQLCDREEFEDHPYCVVYGVEIPVNCFDTPENTQCGLIDSSNSCSEILEDFYPGEDIDVTGRLCNSDELCSEGILVESNDEGYEGCCVGRNSACKARSELTCEEIGFFDRPSQGNHICSGASVELSDQVCCSIPWRQNEDNIYSSSNFLCYKQENNNFFKECSLNPHNLFVEDGSDINPLARPANYLIPLNNLATPSRQNPKSPLVAMRGEPLHSLYNFGPFFSQPKTITPSENNGRIFEVDSRELTNWSSFDNLVFDIIFSSDLINEVMIKSKEGDNLTFSLKDNTVLYKGPLKPHRIIIDINDSSVWEDVGEFFVRKNDTGANNNFQASFIIDNVHLVDSNGNKNTQTKYCTPEWGTWVENLDGDSDVGFYNMTSTFTDKGPFMLSCNAQPSFSWTGNVCCGDDTNKTNNGEFFVDEDAICWKGVKAGQNMAVAEALGSAANETGLEQRLLFYDSEVYGCVNETFASQQSDLFNKSFSFNGSDDYAGEGANNFKNFINQTTIKKPFDTVGSWVCLEDKWQKISEVGRSRLVAATLLKVATSQEGSEEYSIACSKFENVANYVPSGVNDEEGVGSACSLNIAREDDFDDVYVGVALQSLSTDFNGLHNNFLKNFAPFNLEVDKFDCQGDKFFKYCEPLDEQGEEINLVSLNNFRVFFNEDFNIAIISTKQIDSFVSDSVWDSILDFFRNLLGINNAETPADLPLEFEDRINSFYTSTMDNKSVQGFILPTNDGPIIKVQYANITSDIEFLLNFTKAKFSEEEIDSLTNSTADGIKTVLINYSSSGDLGHNSDSVINNWKFLTTGMRINSTD